MAKEIKEAITNEIKQSIDNNYNSIKQLFSEDERSHKMELKELMNKIGASHNNRIAKREILINEIEDK